MEDNEPSFILLIVKFLIAKISYPFIQVVYAAWMNAYSYYEYSHLGAENIAFMFSLFESCKLNDINFGDYIEDILTRLMEWEQDFMTLIPCNYNSNKKVNVKAA